MWFFEYVPTMDNMPAVEWTSDELKLLHEQDLFFVTSDDLATSGRAYRFELRNGEWGWYEVTDADTIKALENAHTAQQSADSKMRNFLAQPVPPYDKGDRWCNATYGELYDNDDLVCITPKAEGEVFDIGDWQPTSMAKSATIKSFVKFTFDENGNKVFESGILLEADEINFKGKVLIDGNFSVDEEGNITLNNLTANNGNFSGNISAGTLGLKTNSTGGSMENYSFGNNATSYTLPSINNESKEVKFFVPQTTRVPAEIHVSVANPDNEVILAGNTQDILAISHTNVVLGANTLYTFISIPNGYYDRDAWLLTGQEMIKIN